MQEGETTRRFGASPSSCSRWRPLPKASRAVPRPSAASFSGFWAGRKLGHAILLSGPAPVPRSHLPDRRSACWAAMERRRGLRQGFGHSPPFSSPSRARSRNGWPGGTIRCGSPQIAGIGLADKPARAGCRSPTRPDRPVTPQSMSREPVSLSRHASVNESKARHAESPFGATGFCRACQARLPAFPATFSAKA
jgi:hypothetical protein